MSREDDVGGPSTWEQQAVHEASGRRIFQRTNGFTHTGNNEGTFIGEVKVEEADGSEILMTSVYVDWEYYGSVTATFSADGSSLQIKTSDGQEETHPLPPARKSE